MINNNKNTRNNKRNKQKNTLKKITGKKGGGSSEENYESYLKIILPHITKEHINSVTKILRAEKNTKMSDFINKINLKKFEFSHLNNLPDTSMTKSQFNNVKSIFVNNEHIFQNITVTVFVNFLKPYLEKSFENITKFKNSNNNKEKIHSISHIKVGGSNTSSSKMIENTFLVMSFVIVCIIYYVSNPSKQESIVQQEPLVQQETLVQQEPLVHPPPKMIYFYDNEEINSQGIDSTDYVKFHLIESSKNINEDDINIIEEIFENNKNMINMMRFYKEKLQWRRSYYDITVQETKLKNNNESFFVHVQNALKNKNVSHFVFDWDRTLQVIEGMAGIKPPKNFPTDFKMKAMPMFVRLYNEISNKKVDKNEMSKILAKYHAGGNKRLKQLQNMFKEIVNNNIPVTIISASRAIITAPDIYETILKEWGCENPSLHYAENGRKIEKIKELQI